MCTKYKKKTVSKFQFLKKLWEIQYPWILENKKKKIEAVNKLERNQNANGE